MLARPDAAVDLAEAALLIAREEYPDLDVGYTWPGWTRSGRAARARPGRRTAPRSSPPSTASFSRRRASAATRDYYDPRNSFLNDVLDRRTGHPDHALHRVHGGRAPGGIEMEGVGLPGHFVVRVAAPDGSPSRRSLPWGAAPSTRLPAPARPHLRRPARLAPAMLAPCGRKAILARMLRNLKGIYVKAGDFERALRTVEMLLRLEPGSAEELRDRGLV